MRYVLYNPLSTRCMKVEEMTEKLRAIDAEEDLRFISVKEIEDGKAFMESLKKDDDIVIAGGDGTLNRLVNQLDFASYPYKVFLLKAGNGNDFLRDLNELKEDYIEITDYLKNLPEVTLNGVTTKYINGVGFGVDGMVCVESDKLKAKGKKKINYTTLSIKLLLFKFKKVNAKVIVDGKEYNFKKVFIGSAMNGKYYGGGMREAPNQDRKSDKISVIVWHDFSKLGALMLFPKIFTGEHVNKEKKIAVLEGKEVEMIFDRPTDLQIDGESYHAVTSYKVSKK